MARFVFGYTSWFSFFSSTFVPLRELRGSELLQESYVVLEKQPYIVNAIF